MFEGWVKAVQNLDTGAAIQRVMNSRQNDLVELNKSQLMQGIKSTGESMSPYSPAYAKRKNKPTTPKTLYDTGDFQGKLYARANTVETEFGSDDSKADYIEDMESYKSRSDPYSIYSLTDENLEKFLGEMGGREAIVAEITKDIMK